MKALTYIFSIASLTVFGQFSNNAFTLEASRNGLSSIMKTNDVHPTNYVSNWGVFGDLYLFYTYDEKTYTTNTMRNGATSFQLEGEIIQEYTAPDSLKDAHQHIDIQQVFSLQGEKLSWTFTLTNTTDGQIRIEDLAIPINYRRPRGESPEIIFEESAIKHQMVSGDNSWVFFQRPTGLPPYLLMTPQSGTSLEYYSNESMAPRDRSFKVFIHSARLGNAELRGEWRQEHTMKILEAGESITYGFDFYWADGYDGIRDLLVEQGLIDVQVIPGMTIPTDLEARVALRTTHTIDSVVAEYKGGQTEIVYNGEKQPDTHHYTVRFNRLGENMLTVYYGGKFKTYLEFFVTEPLETLYMKRADFLAKRQQVKDKEAWYDGLFGVYDMKNSQLRHPGNPDYFDTTRLVYVLTCDDPALCKAPFLAAKNVSFPDPEEIASIEYYIENFVWGKLQRTDEESPYPYGVYGTPDWITNRNREKREGNNPDFRMHVWRSYDYPHIIMMYYHMYQIADMYPELVSYADRDEYLLRAKETAKGYFKYCYEILPWYRTYEWGCYNELLIPELIEVLKKEGFEEDAQFLTDEWEKKVKYFVYDDKYPFRSEYAVDATAFESSYALAKYGATTQMKPDEKLWFDVNDSVWYSHPEVKMEDSRLFMNRQLEANLAVRGVLETTYYWLGSDFRGRSEGYTLSYMSQMGGWAVLDQALYFDTDRDDLFRLGYQSYLSSFALMNTGTPESNYGYWYPGKDNDGATGWAFEPQKYARSWIQKPQGRGPWYYDGEIDLGYGGALRMAATVVNDDDIFGLTAYGGDLSRDGDMISVVPKDGLRRKFHVRMNDRNLDLEFGRDGLVKDAVISFDEQLESITLKVENRTADNHVSTLSIRGLEGRYRVEQDGRVLLSRGSGDTMVSLEMKSGTPVSEVTITR